MNLRYDPDCDAAYISLSSDRETAEATVSLAEFIDEDFADLPALEHIILDFSASGRLTGIEVLNASSVLPKSAL